MFERITEAFRAAVDKFRGKRRLVAQDVEGMCSRLQEALYDADVPHAVVTTFLEKVRDRTIGQEGIEGVHAEEQVLKIVYDVICDILGRTSVNVLQVGDAPCVYLIAGLQGSGKTTTIGKLALWMRREWQQTRQKQLKILCGSVDFQRPAAVEQLQIVAAQAGSDFYRAQHTDPIAASEEIFRYAKHHHYDILLLDTAGRLHTESGLLEELKAIDARIQPAHRLLVVDGMIGQESLEVAQTFHRTISLTGGIITKLDSGARAGVTLGFRMIVQRPIMFIGMGETIDDLELFVPERMARRLIGEGDLATLLERATIRIEAAERNRMEQVIKNGSFTFDDFALQLRMVRKMGSLRSLVSYLPGMGGKGMSDQELAAGEQGMGKFEAMINSMTRKERIIPKLLNNSRKKRIAQGAGVTVAEVNELLRAFEQTQQFAKLMKNHHR